MGQRFDTVQLGNISEYFRMLVGGESVPFTPSSRNSLPTFYVPIAGRRVRIELPLHVSEEIPTNAQQFLTSFNGKLSSLVSRLQPQQIVATKRTVYLVQCSILHGLHFSFSLSKARRHRLL